MKVFEILSVYNVLSNIPFKGNGIYLNNDLKRKIIANKVKYGKLKNEFTESLNAFIKDYITDEMREKLNVDNEYVKQVNLEIGKYQSDLLNEVKEVEAVTFTEDEYNNIIDIMFDDVEFNGVSMPIQDFLEMVYNMFVNKD